MNAFSMKKTIIISITMAMIVSFMGCSKKHEHKWLEADCNSPKRCESCGETEGKPLDHEWKNATCESPKTCKRCGATEGASIGHDWEEATCTDPKTCKRCQKTEGVSLGHNVSKWKTTKKASCSEKGSREGKCARCKQQVIDYIPELPHKTVWVIEKKATLNSSGIRIKTCKVCKAKIEGEAYNLTEAERQKEYIKTCKTIKFSQLARNPNNYKGQHVKYTGQVIQVMQTNQNDGSILYELRVDITKNKYGWYEDTIYVTFTAPSNADRILENDIINIYGEVLGEYSYTAVLGNQVTLPLVKAEYLTIKKKK